MEGAEDAGRGRPGVAVWGECEACACAVTSEPVKRKGTRQLGLGAGPGTRPRDSGRCCRPTPLRFFFTGLRQQEAIHTNYCFFYFCLGPIGIQETDGTS